MNLVQEHLCFSGTLRGLYFLRQGNLIGMDTFIAIKVLSIKTKFLTCMSL